MSFIGKANDLMSLVFREPVRTTPTQFGFNKRMVSNYKTGQGTLKLRKGYWETMGEWT